MEEQKVVATKVPDPQRSSVSNDLFGIAFPLKFEPFVFGMADQLSESYNGGFWDFFQLSNGGFYMAPNDDEPFKVSCPNQFEGELSPDAFGIAMCMYAYSNLSFQENAFGEKCADLFHLLRDYVVSHPECDKIMSAID